MVERELSEGLIVNAINALDEALLDGRSGLMAAIKEGDGLLVAVYDVVNDEVETVTAFRASKLLSYREQAGVGVLVRVK